MYYTYVIRSKKDNKWYTGATKDLRKRFKEHNENEILSTKGRGPFELIFYEACRNQQDAFAREKYLKSGPGKSFLKKRLKRFLSQTGFTLLEVLVAIFMIVVGFSAVLGLINYALKADQSSKMKMHAVFLAQEGIEIVRFLRDSGDWNDFFSTVATSSTVYRFQYDDDLITFSDLNTILDNAQNRADAPLKIDSSGLYKHTGTGASTPFYRTVTLSKPNNDEVKVIVGVRWQERTGEKTLAAEERLWNWR